MASAVLRMGRVIHKTTCLTRLAFCAPSSVMHVKLHQSSKCLGSTPILMPSLSPTMTEGTIVKWYKKEGDPINAGDVLCDIQTDKAVVSMDTEEAGIMAKIIKPENSTEVKIGTLIAVMVEEGDDWQSAEIPEVAAPQDKPQDKPDTVVKVEKTEVKQAPAPSGASRAPVDHKDLHAHGVGPSVRKLMEEYGVQLKDLSGSGPLNRLTKADIMKHIKAKNLQKQDMQAEDSLAEPVATPSAASGAERLEPEGGKPTAYAAQQIPDIEGEEYTDIPNTGMRSTIAKRLTLSKTTIPHSYVTMSCNVGPVSKLRKKMMAEDDVKVSVNDFIIKAAALALQRVPQVNTVWQDDNPSSMLNVDISVAVATDNGLITPIVKNTPQLAVDQISSTVKDLADRARANKLQLHEFQGGTFTISNLGMFGISEFSAVINPPQTAIMAVGSSRLVLGSDGKPESQMCVTLSYDARVIDEGEASQFLEVFRDIIENPELMISGRPASKRKNILM